MDRTDREYYMRLALKAGQRALSTGDVPVGCVIVKDGVVLSTAWNRREPGDATAHAETEAIRAACKALGTWRLENCDLYVTLEPCPMCAGAIINSRIRTLCYGAKDEKAGCCGSVLNLFEERFNHKPKIYGGVLEAECSAALTEFFHSLRGEGGKLFEI